jgi:hypothetical protein
MPILPYLVDQRDKLLIHNEGLCSRDLCVQMGMSREVGLGMVCDKGMNVIKSS